MTHKKLYEACRTPLGEQISREASTEVYDEIESKLFYSVRPALAWVVDQVLKWEDWDDPTLRI